MTIKKKSRPRRSRAKKGAERINPKREMAARRAARFMPDDAAIEEAFNQS